MIIGMKYPVATMMCPMKKTDPQAAIESDHPRS